VEPEREYSEDGVDLTLIRWMLSLTPGERLQVLQQHVNSMLKLRAAIRPNDRPAGNTSVPLPPSN
jgi:hypothetical protein